MSIEFSAEKTTQRAADVLSSYIDLRQLEPRGEDETIRWGSLWNTAITADDWINAALDRRPNRSSLSPTDREWAMRLFGQFCAARNTWSDWSKLSVTLDLDGASGSKPWESLTADRIYFICPEPEDETIHCLMGGRVAVAAVGFSPSQVLTTGSTGPYKPIYRKIGDDWHRVTDSMGNSKLKVNPECSAAYHDPTTGPGSRVFLLNTWASYAGAEEDAVELGNAVREFRRDPFADELTEELTIVDDPNQDEVVNGF